RTTDRRTASYAFAATDGNSFFSSVCRTAASMSCWPRTRAAGLSAIYAATTSSAHDTLASIVRMRSWRAGNPRHPLPAATTGTGAFMGVAAGEGAAAGRERWELL